MESANGGEAAGATTKMAATAGLANGHVNGSDGAGAAGGGEVVTRSKPQVTEACRSSENIGENSSDAERFKSKLTEFTDTGKGMSAQEKQYEENALKAMSEKTDDSEMSSTTEMRLAQRDRTETDDATGAVTKSHFSENQDKKHEKSSKATEKVGDMTASMETSETSHQKSAVSVDASADGSHSVLVDLGNDTSSKSVEEISEGNFKGTRKVETSKSERQMEYTSHSGGGGNGGLKGAAPPGVDMGKQFDELFGSRGEQLKKDRDKRSVSFAGNYQDDEDDLVGGYGGSTRGRGPENLRGEPLYEEDLDYLDEAAMGYGGQQQQRLRAGGSLDYDDYRSNTSAYSSSSSSSSRHQRQQQQHHLEDPDEYRKASWGLSTDRKTADDLVQRILGESRTGTSSYRAPRRYEDDLPSYTPASSRYSGGVARYRSMDEDFGGSYSPAPSPSALKKDSIFKVDMGDGSRVGSKTGTIVEEEERRESYSKSSMDSSRLRESSNGEGRAADIGGDFQLAPAPAPRRPPQKEEMSLLDRRLASMGFDTKLGQQCYVKKDSGNNEGYVETTYISKTKPPGFIKEEEDDMDHEIEAMRNNYRESLQRRSRILQDDYEDDANSLASSGSGTGGYHARGRMVRQRYIDEGEASSSSIGPPPPPPANFIPDDEFMPKKRPETEEVVKERTSEVRTMIERQSSALDKLRDASSSFDELTNEIRDIKQQLMENQLKRNYIMEEEFDRPDDAELEPPRYGGYGGYGGGYHTSGESFAVDQDGHRRYIPRKERMELSRSRSMFDDSYSAREDDGHFQQRDGPPPRTGRFEPTQEEDEGMGGYGAKTSSRAYESSTTSSYTSSATASRYLNRPTFARANTVSDFNFDRPSSPVFTRHDRYDRPSTFSSRFLDKVRDRKTAGGEGTDTESASKRDRPFKSRFLRDSLGGSSSTSSTSSTSYSKSSSSSYSEKSVKSTTSAAADTSVATSGSGGGSEASAPPAAEVSSPAAPSPPKGDSDSAKTESTPKE